MARSNKPIVWGMFAAGGTASAFLVPVVMVVLGFAVPLGLLPAEALSFDRVYAIVAHPLGRLVMMGFITVCLWHAAHRTRTTVHDLGIHNDRATMTVCYGVAGLGTVLTAVFLILL
ncbi:fumarate reductase subunit FrdD [Magnetospira sp. QH-2]|uniref:fumarate reductase subunit FrdD n=1 Tax=Magnetospira sp. (strain QH-2) TaxID=1288970 RepID=UPI0003E80B41|nr:fumarate reductase subunit FrdD [Magnetospira sp. QH-2]CCQ75198.1 Fumarate reductase subunit D [Magnetospira sp. QH-2]